MESSWVVRRSARSSMVSMWSLLLLLGIRSYSGESQSLLSKSFSLWLAWPPYRFLILIFPFSSATFSVCCSMKCTNGGGHEFWDSSFPPCASRYIRNIVRAKDEQDIILLSLCNSRCFSLLCYLDVFSCFGHLWRSLLKPPTELHIFVLLTVVNSTFIGTWKHMPTLRWISSEKSHLPLERVRRRNTNALQNRKWPES